MGKSILLAGDAGRAARLDAKARALGLEPVCIDGSPGVEELLGRAQRAMVRGVVALDETLRDAVGHVTDRLSLPGEGEHLRLAAWDTLAGAGVAVPEQRIARDAADAEVLAGELGAPLWVKPALLRAEPFSMTVENLADLPLAVSKVRAYTPEAPVLLQRPVAGAVCRLVGFKLRRDFHAVEAVGEQPHDETFRVPVELALPCAFNALCYQRVVDYAHRVARRLPFAWYPLELRFVCGEQGPVLTDIHVPMTFEPALAAMLQHALGVDLDTETLRVAVGELPAGAPRRCLGAVAAWLPRRSGVVTSVSGVDTARALPGVQALHLAARPGDVLGHVVDRASRDATGYVVATGGRLEDAATRARDAIAAVEIAVRSAG